MDIYALLSRLPFRRFKEPPPVVGVVTLSGVIGGMGPLRSGLTLSGLAEQLERAFKLPRLKAVALAVNSPGGSPVQSALISQRIRDLAIEHEVPVLAFAEDVAASGGYWLACAGDEIFADENSIIGSVGVISAGFGFSEMIKRIGVERRVHKAGEYKSMLDPFADEDPKDVARLKALQAEIHDSFKAMVRARRGGRLKSPEDALFNGDIWTGRKAVELGLIDGLGELRHVLRERYGEKVQIRRIEPGRSWLRRRLPLSAGAAAARHWADGLLQAIEERALWARFGL